MTIYCIDDFIPERTPRRTYENFIFTENTSVAPHVLDVNLRWLSFALRGDSVWAFSEAERVESTFKLGKYHHWLSLIKAGEPIEAPCLGFDRGRVSITDGRHRLYAFIDLEYTHCKIVVGDRALVAVSTIVDTDEESPASSWSTIQSTR